MAPKHVHDFFSAAYDGELSAAEAERFRAHLDSCAECSQAYDAFRVGIDAVRALPAARMPLPVHLPTDAPVAEQSLRSRVPRLPRLRFIPGTATAFAAVAAAVIVIVALNQHGGTPAPLAGPNAANSPASAASCPFGLASPAPTAALAGYQHQVRASDPGRPGQQLVVATQNGAAAAGTRVLVFAQLTVPRPSAAAPGAAPAASAPSDAIVPCLQLSSSPLKNIFSEAPAQGASNQAAPVGGSQVGSPSRLSTGLSASNSPPLEAFTIPAGTPPGTVISVTAVIPANYPASGDPPLTVTLQITVR